MAVNFAVKLLQSHLPTAGVVPCTIIPQRAESYEGWPAVSAECAAQMCYTCCRQCVNMRELLKNSLVAPWAQLGSKLHPTPMYRCLHARLLTQ